MALVRIITARLMVIAAMAIPTMVLVKERPFENARRLATKYEKFNIGYNLWSQK